MTDEIEHEEITEPGWYWFDTEYPEDGSSGPFLTKKAARDDAINAGVEREFIATWRKR